MNQHLATFWNWFDALEWYWKAFLIILFWWLLAPLYAWTKTEWPVAAKWAVTIVAAVLFVSIAVAQSKDAETPPTGSGTAVTGADDISRPEKTDSGKAKKTDESRSTAEKDPGKAEDELVTVTRIVDGDTIDVRFSDGHTDRVRYIGVDTWETWDQPHGGHGTEANRALVEGKQIRLVKDVSDRDRYNRLLRYVYVGEVFVNAKLVEDGHAKAKDYPPDSAHATEFASLQTQADGADRGCWPPPAVSSPPPPVSTPPPPGDFIGNRNSGKLHNLAHVACQGYVGRMNEGNKIPFSSEAEANAQGFYACLKC